MIKLYIWFFGLFKSKSKPITQKNVTNSIIDIQSNNNDNVQCEDIHNSSIKINVK